MEKNWHDMSTDAERLEAFKRYRLNRGSVGIYYFALREMAWTVHAYPRTPDIDYRYGTWHSVPDAITAGNALHSEFLTFRNNEVRTFDGFRMKGVDRDDPDSADIARVKQELMRRYAEEIQSLDRGAAEALVREGRGLLSY